MENEAEIKEFTRKHIYIHIFVCVSIYVYGLRVVFSLNVWATLGRIGGLQEPMHLFLIGIWLF